MVSPILGNPYIITYIPFNVARREQHPRETLLGVGHYLDNGESFGDLGFRD